MFELSVACKYLLPRRRQLSVSIISIISVLVISLVVWLIVVFFSVTDGLEKSWIQKLTALTAPLRITPTDAYYNSYYYRIDHLSESSNFNPKTIREKLETSFSDPYNPDIDEEIPMGWPEADRNASGELKDLVKLVYLSTDEIKDIAIKPHDFELAGSQIYLKLLRNSDSSEANVFNRTSNESYLQYPTFLGNFESDNTNLISTLYRVETKDINNVLNLLTLKEDLSSSDETNKYGIFLSQVAQERLKNFFSHVRILSLKAKPGGLPVPRQLIPFDVRWTASGVFKNGKLLKVIIPPVAGETKLIQASYEEQQDKKVLTGQIYFDKSKRLVLDIPGENSTPFALTKTPLLIAEGTEFPAELEPETLLSAKRADELKFSIQLSMQGTIIQGILPYAGSEIAKADLNRNAIVDKNSSPLWIYQFKDSESGLLNILPKDSPIGDGVLLPKGFKEAGILIGDRGYLTYVAPTASIIQEQRLPIYVAGFYDPGIIPIGGKFILADRDTLSIIRDAQPHDTKANANGINVRFSDYASADKVKAQLIRSFKEKGIGRYWKVETFKEYEFSKEIMRELQSQKSLFTLIAVVIIIVACSNIISMLVILVNDKKTEIGILRSMGASSKSIAFIFGLSGAAIGIIGSSLGIIVAILTLKNLNILIGLMSKIQGNDILSAAFYGEMIPHELSYEALSFVVIATVIISLMAGIIPATKACLLKPSDILRSTG